MGKKRLIWLPLLCICLLSAPAAAKLMAVGNDSTDSPVVEIDEITGLFRLIGGSGFPNLNSLAQDDAGRLLSVGGADNNQLIAINPRTGRGTALLTLDFGDDPVNVYGLAFTWLELDEGPRLWAVNRPPGIGLLGRDLFRINLATGVGTRIDTDPLGLITSITPFFGVFYCWDLVLGLGQLDVSTGLFTDSNPALGDILGIQGIAYKFPFWLYGVGCLVGEHDKLYTIDGEGNCELVSTATHTYDLRGLEYVYNDKIEESVGIGVRWSGTDSRVVQINPDTGLLNTIGQSGFPNLNSLARNHEGKLYTVGGADFNQLIRISRINGAGTLVTTLDFGDTPVDVRGLALIGEGLFATNCRPDSSLFDLFRIDLATGIGTRINPEDSPLPRLQGLTSSGWGILYGWDAATNGLIWINKDTGAFASVNPGMTGPSGIQSIAFSADGNLYGIGQVSGENTKLYLIDSLTGACSLVGDTGGKYDVRGLEFVPPIKLKVAMAAIHLLLLNDPPKWLPVD
jgi:hypothetical protein